MQGSYNRGFLQPGVLQPGVSYNQGSHIQGFLQPGVPTTKGLSTIVYYNQGLTTRGSYSQRCCNQTFLQPRVLQPGVPTTSGS